MTDRPEPLHDLAAQAHAFHVVVVGGGIAGLIAAYECAKVGMPVTLVEASQRFGGIIAEVEVGGLRVDVGATCWSSGGALDALVDELGLADRVVSPSAAGTWIAGLGRGAAAPVPDQTLLGIPANPWDPAVRRFIGWPGAWRAYLDRLRPPLTIGKERNLGRLVRTRMGDAVLERLVAPLSLGRFGVSPDDVDVTSAAPGLNTALTRTGSLGGAVADMLVDRPAGPSLQSLEGGMPRLVDALVERLGALGARLVLGVHVEEIERSGTAWQAVAQPGHGSGDSAEIAPADVIFVATGPADADRLLAPLVGDAVTPMTDAATSREIVTLVVDAPPLDAAPRGAEVYAVPGSGRASGLVHQTARWPWLARVAAPGRHVLSVAFDGPDETRATAGLADADVAQLAREEASALLGVTLDETSVQGSHRTLFPLARPVSTIGHEESATAVRRAIGAHPGLAAVGAWIAGSGLAQVGADAQDEAERVRKAALWGAPGAR